MGTDIQLTKNESRYLKMIYREQQEESGKVSTTSIAREVGVEPATVTETLQNLAKKNILEYKPYHGVHLTEKGLTEARNILRKHRLLEFLFHERFDYLPEESCSEASKIDFRVSDRLVNSICRTYGHPESCPCNKRIFRITECVGSNEGKIGEEK